MTQGFWRGFRPVFGLFLLTAALCLPAAGVAAGDPAGDWLGKVKTPAGKDAEIRLTLTPLAEGWAATLTDTTLGAVTLTNVKVGGDKVSFTFQPAGVPYPAHFFGDYDPLDDRLSGTFSVRGTSRFVKFERAPFMSAADLAAMAAPKEPARIRHDYRFGASGRLAYWAPLHVVKDEIDNINTLTAGTSGVSAALKAYVQDGFCVFARYYRGGQGFGDEPAAMAQWPDLGLNSDSYLKLDGWEIGLAGFLGNKIMKTSDFNPYLTAAAGRTTWAVTDGGRGGDVLTLERYPLEGKDTCLSAGLGTEYELNQKLQLEFEIMWRFVLTKDEALWPEPESTWSNTHAWTISAGATYGFY